MQAGSPLLCDWNTRNTNGGAHSPDDPTPCRTSAVLQEPLNEAVIMRKAGHLV